MSLNERQKKFAEEYLVDLDPVEAYTRAGYKANDRKDAQTCSARLLRNVGVLAEIDRIQVARMESINLDNDWIIGRFRAVYLRATKDRDYSSALRALENIAKHVGFYLEDNQQKAGTDVEANRQRLKEMGFDADKLFRFTMKANVIPVEALNGHE